MPFAMNCSVIEKSPIFQLTKGLFFSRELA
jgi:hypothetical protein